MTYFPKNQVGMSELGKSAILYSNIFLQSLVASVTQWAAYSGVLKSETHPVEFGDL